MDLKYSKTALYLVLSNSFYTLNSRFTWLEYINISVKTATECSHVTEKGRVSGMSEIYSVSL